MERYHESNHKKIGVAVIDSSNIDPINGVRYKPYIKILHLPTGYTFTIDFRKFTTQADCLFFINANQYFQMGATGVRPAP